MKKYLALLLSMLLLVGCARIEPEQGGTKPEPGQPDDVSAKLLSQYALAEVKLPELPAEPSEEELWTAYEKLDYDKMGEEVYHKAQEELWDDFDARSRAYSDAVKALRGEGVDKTMTPALLGRLDNAICRIEANAGNTQEADRWDREFHLILLESCGNRVLQVFSAALITYFEKTTSHLPQNDPSFFMMIAQQERELLRAIQRGDEEGAKALLSKHLKEQVDLLPA